MPGYHLATPCWDASVPAPFVKQRLDTEVVACDQARQVPFKKIPVTTIADNFSLTQVGFDLVCFLTGFTGK